MSEYKETVRLLRLPRNVRRLIKRFKSIHRKRPYETRTSHCDFADRNFFSAGKSHINRNMNKYVNREKRNEHEERVRRYFDDKGYNSLARGWPDFVFFKFKGDGKVDAVFVEVKRPNQTMIKPHQNTMRKIFKRLGIDVKVCFGMLEDGAPNFKEIEGRRMVDPNVY